jgi:hypothetical protein
VYLYPRLPMRIAQELAEDRANRSPAELRSPNGELDHPAVWYAPTGGNRVDEKTLREIQHLVRDCADRLEYPAPVDDLQRHRFDAECAVILYENMGIGPAEAAQLGVWAFMTCIMLPDIVRWRFPGEAEKTPIERFIGSARGLRRNTFGRLWWRAYLLCLPDAEKPYELLSRLSEDDLVQITERPSLAGSSALVRQVCISFLQTVELDSQMPRRELIRDAVKRVRRLLPMISFDMLDRSQLQDMIDEIFLNSAAALAEG